MVFGNQEISNVGYNPKYHGRPSFKEKVGMISGSKELIDLTLKEGSHHSNHAFLDFFEERVNTLPAPWILKESGAIKVSLTKITLLTLKNKATNISLKLK